jgi:hypothetical protein
MEKKKKTVPDVRRAGRMGKAASGGGRCREHEKIKKQQQETSSHVFSLRKRLHGSRESGVRNMDNATSIRKKCTAFLFRSPAK